MAKGGSLPHSESMCYACGQSLSPEIELQSVTDTERITCVEDGCKGCNAIHRRVVGEPRYYIDGELASRAAYEEMCELILGHIEVTHG